MERARQRSCPRRTTRGAPRVRYRAAHRRPGDPPARADDRCRTATTTGRAALGTTRVRGVRPAGRADPPARRRDRAHAAAHDHRRRDRPHRRHRARRHRRGDRGVSPGRWDDDVAARNHVIAEAGQWRTVRSLDGRGPAFTLDDGRRVVSFASNDYLGLSQHRSVIDAARNALDRWGAGSGSARLIVGARPVHRELEAELASWKGAEAALLFPTGFSANLGALTTFATD